jgi:hypothetical protein
MTPQPAEAQAVRETYSLLRSAAAHKQPVAATYDGLFRLLCPHVLGRKAGRLHVFCDFATLNWALPQFPCTSRGARGWSTH